MLFSFSSNRTKLRQQCEVWFLEHRHRLLGYARLQVSDGADEELLLSEVMERVMCAYCARQVDLEGLLPYSLRSIYHAALRLRTRNRRRQQVETTYQQEKEREHTCHRHPSHHETTEDVHDELRSALQQLKPELATIVTLRIWEEETFADISRKLRLPESTVRSHFARALQQIKQLMTRETA